MFESTSSLAASSSEQDLKSSSSGNILEQLVRNQSVRPRSRAIPLELSRFHPRRIGGMPVIAVSAVVAVALVGGFVAFRRPPTTESLLPMVSSTLAPEAGGAAAPVSSSSIPSGPMIVHVAGAVGHPGVVSVAAGARVTDAVAAAGGLRADADPDRVNLAAPLKDGERIAVPVIGQPAPAVVSGGGSPTAAGSTGNSTSATSTEPINLNTASESELEELPGVGPATAAAIVAHREQSGSFSAVDDLLEVRGIGEAKLEGLRDAVTVGQ